MASGKRKARKPQPIKVYGRILKYHRCGRGIFVGDDGRFFPAEERGRDGVTYGEEAIAIRPDCDQALAAEDLDYSEEQLRHLAKVYRMLLEFGRQRRAEREAAALADVGGWNSPAMPLRYVEAAKMANEGVRA